MASGPGSDCGIPLENPDIGVRTSELERSWPLPFLRRWRRSVLVDRRWHSVTAYGLQKRRMTFPDQKLGL
jgi:hypothetical protein